MATPHSKSHKTAARTTLYILCFSDFLSHRQEHPELDGPFVSSITVGLISLSTQPNLLSTLLPRLNVVVFESKSTTKTNLHEHYQIHNEGYETTYQYHIAKPQRGLPFKTQWLNVFL